MACGTVPAGDGSDGADRAARPAPPPPLTAVGAAPSSTSAAPVPAGLRLPTIDIAAAVVPVGVDERGEMGVPTRVQTVGWYRFGPGPGSGAGSVVLAGHVDDRIQGRGAFYGLVDLVDGDPVQVELPDGALLDYRVRAVERIAKSDLPVDRLFARDGPELLTLVTCGGEFDRSTRSYRENVVVTAERAW